MSRKVATVYAILAAVLYAVNIPLSKVLLQSIAPTMLAGLLYLGAGVGIGLFSFIKKDKLVKNERLTGEELPYIVAMVLLDIAAPIFLLLGLESAPAENVSLINNLEIVATALIAKVIFKEYISNRLYKGIAIITLAGVLLSFEGMGAFRFSTGSLLVMIACICWGLENNCTRKLSEKSSEEIVIIKGIFSGMGALIIAIFLGESFPEIHMIFLALLLGFVSYGLSINFYVQGQRELGATKTGAYYALAPFIGVVFSFIILGESPNILFWTGLVVMIVGSYLVVTDNVGAQHTHIHSHWHSHEHKHEDYLHTHGHIHEHSHLHIHEAEREWEHEHFHKEEEKHIHKHK